MSESFHDGINTAGHPVPEEDRHEETKKALEDDYDHAEENIVFEYSKLAGNGPI